MSHSDQYDLIILGSGSTAFAAALRAQELGKTAVMIEERQVGGTCVNRGCLPSKNLIEAAKLVFDAQNPRYPGLTPATLKVDFPALIAQKDDVIAGYRAKHYESLVGDAVTILEGHVRFLNSNSVEVDGKRLSGEKFLIATGSRPVLPSIKGLEDVPYLTSDLLTHNENMELRECPTSLIIIGGGYIALELGQMFARFGTKVTILERNSQLLAHGYDEEVGQAIRPILEAEGISVVTNARVEQLKRCDAGVTATVFIDNVIHEITAERVLAATGRRPNTDTIGIVNANVSLTSQDAVAVNSYLQTSISHIFAAGDVIGKETHSQMATPVGSQDGGIAAHNALSGEEFLQVDHRVIPRAIFTDPQIGIVGMTESEAVAAGHQCWCNTIPMSVVPRAGAIRDTKGVIKMVADENSGEVLGVSMVGNSAAEVIHEAAMGMRFHATIADFISQLHVYPTMAEALKIAAISRYKDPSKLSCCAS